MNTKSRNKNTTYRKGDTIMKYITIYIVVFFALLLTACASVSQPAAPAIGGAGSSLLVSGGDIKKSYTHANLETLPASQSTFKDVNYKGVLVSDLLKDAGFDPQKVKALKAVASDGYTINYDPTQFLGKGVMVAYSRADGDLAPEDGSFRMVLPDAEGKLNLRKLVELQIIQ
jgi:hypothetical protein